MRFILLICLLFLSSTVYPLTPFEQRMLDKGKPFIGDISWAFDAAWGDSPMRLHLFGQIEKESLWDKRAVLCVPKPTCSREKGIGLGQFTITPRFNAFQEVSVMHPLLRDWKPEDYTDHRKQILAMVVKNRAHFRQCSPLMDGTANQIACVLSSYNGGHGGFLADRRLCGNTAGCNPRKWEGNVADTSLKAKTALPGYGQSFFKINRGYVCQIINVRSPKYAAIAGIAPHTHAVSCAKWS